MTIKHLHELTPADHKIFIGWDGAIRELDRGNALEMNAYGAFTIARICVIGENKLEADLLAQPVKED